MATRKLLAQKLVEKRGRIEVDKDEDEVKKLWKGYTWESNKVRSWEQIEEDPATGRLKSFGKAEQVASKKRRDDGLSGVRRGVIRFCVLILDMSETVRLNDYKPSRGEVIADAVISFVAEFFDHNPISQLAIVVTRDSDACKMTSFSSNGKIHAEAVRKALRLASVGSASLQNSINVARRLLDAVPPYGMREILICFASLSTCDPGDIHVSIQTLAAEKVKCSAIGMAAELYVLRELTKVTEGQYVIAMDENHFRESLSQHVIPPPTTSKQVTASLIRMGYPSLLRIEQSTSYANNPTVRGRLGYKCPRCDAWLSDMPCECTLCGMMLVSSPHLARSYHHLFPVTRYISLESIRPADCLPNFDAFSIERRLLSLQGLDYARCNGCAALLRKEDALRVVCPSCLNIFCAECDAFVHDALHHCPGCLQPGVTASFTYQ